MSWHFLLLLLHPNESTYRYTVVDATYQTKADCEAGIVDYNNSGDIKAQHDHDGTLVAQEVCVADLDISTIDLRQK